MFATLLSLWIIGSLKVFSWIFFLRFSVVSLLPAISSCSAPSPLNLGSLKVKGPCVQKLCICYQETGLNQDSSKAPKLQLGGFVGLLVLVCNLGDTIWMLTVVLILLYPLLYDLVNRGCRWIQEKWSTLNTNWGNLSCC